jgi:hypothetical protein
MRALILLAVIVLACDDGEAKPRGGDCREAAHQCALGFGCVQCAADASWRCAPVDDPSGASVCPGAAADAGKGADRIVGTQDGRRLCARGFKVGPTVEVDALGVRIVANCNSEAVVVHLEGDPSALRCTGVDTSRPCPQTVLANGGATEMQIGTPDGQARVENGRLIGECTCHLPASGALPARDAKATFDVAWPR